MERSTYPVLATFSDGYPRLKGRLSTCYSPVRHSNHFPKKAFSFDLHVLSIPPAFVLSQDQTLKLNGRNSKLLGPKYLKNVFNPLKCSKNWLGRLTNDSVKNQKPTFLLIQTDFFLEAGSRPHSGQLNDVACRGRLTLCSVRFFGTTYRRCPLSMNFVLFTQYYKLSNYRRSVKRILWKYFLYDIKLLQEMAEINRVGKRG